MTHSFRIRLICLLAAGLALGLGRPAAAKDLAGTAWRVTFETGRLGPVETVLAFEKHGQGLRAVSRSGAVALLRALPQAAARKADLEAGLLVIDFTCGQESCSGTTVSPWPGHGVTLAPEGEALKGSVAGGYLQGSFTGAPATGTGPLRDYPAILADLHRVVTAKLFNPEDTDTDGYRLFSSRMDGVAAAATDDLDFLFGFIFAWENDPFSHFNLRRSAVPAEAMMQHFDRMRIGKRMAEAAFDGNVAVLTVRTMMGADTIDYVRQSYEEIAAHGSKALVIDLRGNGGGAFAVKPLVEHVIDEPLESGYFLSRAWNARHDRLPTKEELEEIEPWEGFSIISFWRDVQTMGVIKLRFEPAEPNFDGPVFVVTDGQSASATELAVDALRASGLVTVVGERTAGQMLSQSPFDVMGGFQVSLPIADYYSTAHGRIEGVGIAPDVEAPSADALDKAKALAREALAEAE